MFKIYVNTLEMKRAATALDEFVVAHALTEVFLFDWL
jgi:hypothetical protein